SQTGRGGAAGRRSNATITRRTNREKQDSGFRRVGQGRHWTDPKRSGFSHSIEPFGVRRASDPLRMIGKPADDGLLKRTLEIECRLIAFDPGLAETFQDRADVLMLVLDRPAASADEFLKRTIALRLAERLPRKLH